MSLSPRDVLIDLFQVAVDSARPETCLPAAVTGVQPPIGQTIVVGAGKAAASMARALERHWDKDLGGLVVVPYGNRVPTQRIEVIEAAHPVPDNAAQSAARRMLEVVHGLTPVDLVLGLWSGGGSSILALPAPGITLAQKQEVSRQLLKSGATISEINCVRKHLSAIKGGRLAMAAAPAEMLSLVISDIPGDDLGTVASGPMFGDPTTSADAIAVMDRYGIATLPFSESPKPDHPAFRRHRSILLASSSTMLERAKARALEQGLHCEILHDIQEGEARELGRQLAEQAMAIQSSLTRPMVLLTGGESTVTVRGTGRGGRNVEFLTSLALYLDGRPGIHAIAADTDGIDGIEPIAGAVIDPDSLQRAREQGIDVDAILANNDTHTLFERLGDQVITGPTLTNVNDFRAIYIES